VANVALGRQRRRVEAESESPTKLIALLGLLGCGARTHRQDVHRDQDATTTTVSESPTSVTYGDESGVAIHRHGNDPLSACVGSVECVAPGANATCENVN
jgi:hypothetical protein